MRTTTRAMVSITTATLLAGVGACSQHQSQPQSSGTSFDVPRKTLADATVPAPSEPAMIDFQQSGGIAGVARQVSVWPSGQVRFGGKGAATGATQLSPQRLADITTLFDGWDKLHPEYPAPKGTADAFQYDVSYQGKRVRFSEASADAPKSLHQIAERLNALTSQPSTAAQ